MRKKKNTRTALGSRGMSLVEAVVWVALFIAVMLALVSSLIYFYRTNSYALQQASAIVSAQRGIDLMIRTLREASYASNGAYPIISMSTYEIQFYADIDGDTGIEKVRYFLSGDNLMKGIVNPSGDPPVYTAQETTSIVSEDLRNVTLITPIFTYYDGNGLQINDLTRIGEVRFIAANLLIDVNPDRTPTPISMRSSAALRNLAGR